MTKPRVVVLGGGPGGYEAALVAAQLGADVTVVEAAGLGGSAVLTDVVPSKTLIATAEAMHQLAGSGQLGLHVPGAAAAAPSAAVEVDLAAVNRRVRALAQAQSDDVRSRLEAEGVRLIRGRGRLDGPGRVVAYADGTDVALSADAVLVATGASPRELADAAPDGERILTWKQLYQLPALPQRLIVVGSGVTGAEFASGYHALGADVVLVSSRERVLPGEDADAAMVLEAEFGRRGLQLLARSRAAAARLVPGGVVVELTDGRKVEGTHCLMAVGSVPNTAGIGLAEAGVVLSTSGHVEVDRVSRTRAPGVYAAGDCTGVLALASVAAMQGRIAMWHALGDAVTPMDMQTVSSTVFTAPEIATVGATERDVESGRVAGSVLKLPLAGNPRAKMQGIGDGFVKLIRAPGHGAVLGGVVVAPRASELIYPLTLAVTNRLTVDDVARAFTIYPSLSGSIAEAARRLHSSP